MAPKLEGLCDGLLAAMLNGVYQGIFLTFLGAIYLKLSHRLNAATRHAALLSILLVVVFLPLIHFAIGGKGYLQEGAAPSAPNPAPSPEMGEGAPARAESPGVPDREAIEPAVESAGPISAGEFANNAAAAVSLFQRVADIEVPPLAIPAWASIGLVAGWLSLSGALLSRLAWQLRVLRSWKRTGKSAPDDLRELFQELSVELNVTRSPRLLISDQTAVPIAGGFRRPAVLLPASMIGKVDSAGARQILRHELAHLNRYDDWANLAQQIAKAVFFFHPAVWILDRHLTLEREIACDDQVLAAVTDRRSYALFLAEFASRSKHRQLMAVTAAWSNKGQLKERINMILNSQRNTSPRLARARVGVLTLGAALIALLALRTGPRVLFAQEAPAPVTTQTSSNFEPPKENQEARDQVIIASTDARPDQEGNPNRNSDIRISKTDSTIATIEGGPRVKTADGATEAEPAVRARARKDGDEANIERRLERLERMVKSLVDREKSKGRNDREPRPNAPEVKIVPPSPKQQYSKLNEEDVARIVEKAKAEADRGRHEAERAIKEAQRAISERGLANHADGLDGLSRHALETQHHVLEAQHAALEKQMKVVEKQLARLEKNGEKLEEKAEKVEKMEKDHGRQKRLKSDDGGENDSPKDKNSGESDKNKQP